MLKTKANEVEDHVIYCFVGNSSDIPVTAPVREWNKVELQTFKSEIQKFVWNKTRSPKNNLLHFCQKLYTSVSLMYRKRKNMTSILLFHH